MRLELSGHQFTFPTRCACCHASANAQLLVSASKSTGKRVVHTKTQVWDIPYCTRCLSHVKAAAQAATTAKTLTALSIIAALILCYITSSYLGLILGILGVAGTIMVHNQQLTKARQLCGPSCVSVRAAVAYLGWYGTLHQFEIGSRDFAREFMAANQRKLVNLSPQAQQVLAAGSPAPVQNAPRSPRRYMT